MIFNFVLLLIALLLNNSLYTIAIVPKPSLYEKSSTVCHLKRPLDIQHNYSSCNILSGAVKRFQKRLELKHPPISEKVEVTCNIDTLNIKIELRCDESLGQLWPSSSASTDESYYMKIEESQITIDSSEVWGVLHALETILQLVYQGEDGANVIFQGSLMDEPEFVYRGMLIDTARHFLPLDVLKKLLDSMAMVKMNVFHWHITDDQSFPFVSTTWPKLSEQGAYHPLRYTYTEEDVAKLLDYARQRGIRVIPEFDTPAHTLSWGKGYPDLLTKCYDGAQPNGKLGPLNPVNSSLYEFLEKFFKEIVSRFHDNYIHLGGNEVDYECWRSNPEITRFMKDMKFGQDYYQLHKYYLAKLIEIVKNMTIDPALPITPIAYQESYAVECEVDHRTIIHVWKTVDWKQRVYDATLDGYRVIVSATWNLTDIQTDDLDWMSYYAQNIRDFGGLLEQTLSVIGGEATVWSTHVDATNIMSLAWPRGAAIAERLWTKHLDSIDEFGKRLDELRCRMRQNGIPAHPVLDPGFCPF